jgi:hypothetical protein
MSKLVTITIQGYGQELVQGTWPDEEIIKLTKNIDDPNDNDVSSVIWELHEILPDSYDWYDRDNLCHYYGGLASECSVTILQGDKETDYTDIWQLGATIDYEEEYNYTGKENIITSISSEKGVLFGGNIELNDTEEFDVTKLTIATKGVIFNGHENELITKVSYDNREVDNDFGADTNGKGFYAYLQKKK